MKAKWLRAIPALALVLLLALSAGCGNQAARESSASSTSPAASSAASSSGKDASSSSAPGARQAPETKTLSINVYYPNEQGTKLVASTRKIKTSGSKDKYTAALESLLSGPTEQGMASIVPKKTKLQSVTLKDGTAVVSFSSELQKNFVGGSTGEEMLVGSIVNTLTEFSEVQQVRILIDGKTVESLSGHMDLSAPIPRMEELL